MDDIDYERLREDIIDYYGTAAFSGNIGAMGDMEKAERASNQELLKMAKECGININKYKTNYR